MLNDSRAAFPNRIRALVADSDARFLKSASLMLSLLNFRVATCETPAAAVKLLSGRLQDADVVFIDALRATTCGFDFRGIVESHLSIPVIYFFSFNYNIASNNVADALRRNVFAATYVIKKPLDAEDISRLWRIIQWSQVLLRRGKRTLSWLEWPRGNEALPPAVEAVLASPSTIEDQGEEEDDGSDLFRVVREGRARWRKLGDSHDDGGSSSHGRGRGRGSIAVGGRSTRNVTEVQEGDDDVDVVPSHQQQNRRGVQTMGVVQNQQHGRSLLFMQPIPHMPNVPRNSPMISADAAGPSSSNVAAWTRDSNTSAPALRPLPAIPLPARATSPAPPVYSAQATAPRLPPAVYQQQQPVAVAAARAGRKRKADSHDRGFSGRGRGRGGRGGIAASLEIGGHPTRRLSEQMNLTEGEESDDDDVVVVSSHQQAAAQQNRRGVQAMDVQNQQHRRSLFMQPVPQMVNVPCNNPMIPWDTAGPSSSDATAFAGASNTSAPALLPAYQAPARARETSLAPHVVYSAQAPAPELPPPVYQQQQPIALYNFGNMIAPPAPAPTLVATSGQQPQFTLQRQDMFAPGGQGSWMGCRRETTPTMLSFQQPPAANPFRHMAGGDTTFGASPAGATEEAGAYRDAAVAHLQSPSVPAQPAHSFDDVLRAMMEMNCSADEAPATDELAAMQAAQGGGYSSNYNAGSSVVTDVNGGSSSSLMAPQDVMVPTGNQVELEAPEIYDYGSLVESPESSAMFNGNGEMAASFLSDQDNDNAMLSLDTLWDFKDDVSMHPEGQQVAAADDSANTSHSTSIISNGGENSGGLGPNRNTGAADDKNNGHQ